MNDWPESVSLQVNRRAKSISLRLVLFTTGVFGIISAAGLVYFFQKRLELTVSNTIGTLQQSISLGDIYQLKKLADSLVSGGAVSGVWINDKYGDILVEKLNEAFEGNLKRPQQDGTFLENGHVLTSYRSHIVDRNGKKYGEIVVADPFPLSQFAFSLLFLIAILALGALYLIYSFKQFGSYISQPLLEFCDQLSNVDQYNRGLSLNKPFREIALLESEFNNLLIRAMNSEQKERDAEKQAAIGRIITQISHDMRAPIGVFENLLTMPQNTLLSTQVSAISASVHRLYAMIESLRRADLELLISRALVVLDMDSALEALHGIASKRKISLQVKQPSRSIRIFVDYPKLERAWINLVSNALDFATTSITVEVDRLNADLIIRIVDDGSGVPDEFLHRLFQRGATYGKADGTGLGLAYARQIMRGHGGDVSYRRENGLTIFECRLPNVMKSGRDQIMENTASFQIQSKQNQAKIVAIHLEPEQLSAAVLTKMTSLNSEEFFFTEDRSEANIIVSNIEKVMFEALENDEQEFVSVTIFKNNEALIVDLLKKKFNIL